MQVIGGDLKGRPIPFNNRRQGNARVTSDFVKKAVFSSLGETLSGLRFLDLFACSGQIGFEAYSRGAQVVLNEPDRRRNRFIAECIAKWKLVERIELCARPAEHLLPQFAAEGRTFDIAYLDPPYRDQFDAQPIAQAFLIRLSQIPIFAPNARIVVQHAADIALPETLPFIETIRHKRYGDTAVTTFLTT